MALENKAFNLIYSIRKLKLFTNQWLSAAPFKGGPDMDVALPYIKQVFVFVFLFVFKLCLDGVIILKDVLNM